jgi:DNA-binding NarL/FixJ family response regulator
MEQTMTPEIAPARLKILVLGDDTPLRNSVVQYIGVIISSAAVDEAPSHAGADEFVRAADWNLIILAIDDTHVLAELQRLKQLQVTSPILVLTTVATPDIITAAVTAGAAGCLRRSSAAGEWKRAIESVAFGGTYLGVRP